MAPPKRLIYVRTDGLATSEALRGVPAVEVAGRKNFGPIYSGEIGDLIKRCAVGWEVPVLLGSPHGVSAYAHDTVWIGRRAPTMAEKSDASFAHTVVTADPGKGLSEILASYLPSEGKKSDGKGLFVVPQRRKKQADGHVKRERKSPSVQVANGKTVRYGKPRLTSEKRKSRNRKAGAGKGKNPQVSGRVGKDETSVVVNPNKKDGPVTSDRWADYELDGSNSKLELTQSSGHGIVQVSKLLRGERIDPLAVIKHQVAPKDVRAVALKAIAEVPESAPRVTQFLESYKKWGDDSRKLVKQGQRPIHWNWGA